MAAMDVMTEEEEVEEEGDYVSSETPPSSSSSPTPLAATTDILTGVEAGMAEEEKTDKDGDSKKREVGANHKKVKKREKS